MDDASARQRLDAERARLAGLRSELLEGGLTRETEAEQLEALTLVTQHPADFGTETFDIERDLSLLEQVEAELADVEDALRRLEEGRYGLCEVCGRPIEEERLAALPAARRCLVDQERAERSGPGGHPSP